MEFIRQPGGLGIDYVYDTSTRQLVSIVADGVQNATFGYYTSSVCEGCASGRLQTAARGATTVTLGYNGPLTTSQAWSGTSADSVTGSVSWTYNSDLRATSETVAPAPTALGLATVSYAYDPDGMPTCASLGGCAAGAPNQLSLSYSATIGALTGTSLGSVGEAYANNAYGEQASYSVTQAGSALFGITYDDGTVAGARDALGRVQHESEADDPEDTSALTTNDYQYDEQGRLWKYSQNGVLMNEYHYDSRGNRTWDAVLLTADYDDQDRLLDYAGATYSYWPNGARHTRVRGSSYEGYVYDSLGNLSEVVVEPSVTIDYVVDAFNRRILKKRNGTPYAGYLYGAGSRIAAVLDGSGNLAARFVYASHPNTPDFMVLADGTIYKFLCDQLGSPRVIVNVASGAIAETIAYDPWGQVSVLNYGEFAAWQQPFGFAGGLYDEDTQLVRFGARDYDAQIGRWLAKDPILLNGGQTNLYVYAWDDPINFIDPLGTDVWSAAASFGYGVGGAVVGSVVVAGLIATGSEIAIGAAVGLVGYGGYALGKDVVEAISGEDLWSGANFGIDERGDLAAGALGGLLGGELGAWGLSSGREFEIPFDFGAGPNGKPARVAPWGNRTGNEFGERPHYHRAVCDPNSPGNSAPGQGMRNHRPWEGGF